MPRRSSSAVHPRPLRPGDTLAIVAPAGPVTGREGVEGGIRALERLGFRVHCPERVFDADGYLAGSDEGRARELVESLADPALAGIIALRGGYGSARLLPYLTASTDRADCKIFMGFSDLTTLHLYWRRRFGWATVHGPMLTSTALHAPPPGAAEHLFSLWTDPGYRPRLHFAALETWYPGTAEGPLVGGCLSLVAASLGTPYEVDTRGTILFLEDLAEPPYRVDRMLTHLRLAGKLDRVKGVLLGSFDGGGATGEPGVAEALRRCLLPLKVPVVARFPSGHGSSNWALPLHVRARLDGTGRVLEILDPLVASAAA